MTTVNTFTNISLVCDRMEEIKTGSLLPKDHYKKMPESQQTAGHRKKKENCENCERCMSSDCCHPLRYKNSNWQGLTCSQEGCRNYTGNGFCISCDIVAVSKYIDVGETNEGDCGIDEGDEGY